MHFNKDQQQQRTMKKKLNKGQATRRVQYFKKKNRKSNIGIKTISNQANHQYQEQAVIELDENEPLSIVEQSSVKKKYSFSYTGSNIDPSQFLSDYSMISNEIFQQILLKTITIDTDRQVLVELLNDEETLTLTRQLGQFINKLNYSKLQYEQWTYYYNLGITEDIWTGRVSKKMAMLNSMCHTYGRRKQLIEQRRKYFQQQIQDNTIQLDEHIKKVPSSFDTHKIIQILNDFIHTKQSHLRIDFERRRGMLKFDANDHQLVEAFYQLKPRKTEVCTIISN